jgi:hypothetical protein
VRRGIDGARVGRWGGLRGGGRGCSRRPAEGLRVFYGHDLVPEPGSRRRRDGEVPEARLPLAERLTTSRCCISGRRGYRATGALLRLARRRGVPVVVNRTGSPIRAGPARGRMS